MGAFEGSEQEMVHAGGRSATAVVLVVDDVPENLTVLGELLQPTYEVIAALTGERALELADRPTPPDLILLDVMLPHLDGFAVLARLRANPRTKDIPVIFVTALGDASSEERGISLGAVDYITKPIRPVVVLARVHAQIEARRARAVLNGYNAFLEAEVKRRMVENDRTQLVTIRALAHLAETRDPETGNHILRTQAYVNLLARRLSGHPRFAATLDARFIELLTRSAPLHDIGKVGIPDHILLKPGKLTPDEWEVMKTHAAVGAEAIERAERDIDQPVAFLQVAKQVCRWHHERWDGGGYPDGLRGDDIPLAARIMTLADVFDALINRRVYKAPMPAAEARAIIVAERGRQFDPDVVDAFVADFDEFVVVAERYAEGA